MANRIPCWKATNMRIDETKAYHFTSMRKLDEPVNSLTFYVVLDNYGNEVNNQIIINDNENEPLNAIGYFDFYDYKAFICYDKEFHTFEIYQYSGDDVWYITNSIDNFFEAITIESYIY